MGGEDTGCQRRENHGLKWSVTTGMGRPKWPLIGAALRRWISSHGWQRWPGRPRRKPRVNLTRYHGVLACAARPEPPLARARHASQARERHQVHRQRRTPHTRRAPCRDDPGAAAQARLNGAAIRIDIEVCNRCGGSVRVIACREDQEIIDRILAHLHKTEQATPALPLLTPPSRAPPETVAPFAGKGAR
jgi:hypothetical protein